MCRKSKPCIRLHQYLDDNFFFLQMDETDDIIDDNAESKQDGHKDSDEKNSGEEDDGASSAQDDNAGEKNVNVRKRKARKAM